ncbi:hypothetical protein AXF42_Ash002770 [Apostasia shenzhenica]|uniref:Retrovirus-related Pol polyprotein from transposon TNT 1-94 n=1 Tax=Apostasia shenzhenica TaxID=1088818 RepID=A0A2I0A7A5_9ASPA|nr:hypothetical protein AXF42_Ash002770 [Apostasia shenzhenica]
MANRDNSDSSSTTQNFSNDGAITLVIPLPSLLTTPSMPKIAQLFQNAQLKHDNYNVWMSLMLATFNAANLKGLVDGTWTCPSPTITDTNDPTKTTSNPAFLTWYRYDQLVLSWLLASLSESVLPHAAGFSISRAVWEALERTYGSPSPNHALQLRLQLQSLHKGDSSIHEYLQKAKCISDTLTTIGDPVAPTYLLLCILHGLRPEYESFATSITTRIDFHSLTLDRVHGMLLSHEILL